MVDYLFFLNVLFTASVDKYDYQKWYSHFMGAKQKHLIWGAVDRQRSIVAISDYRRRCDA